MNIKLIKLLSVLCVVLLAGIVGEWFYAKQAQKKTLAALKIVDKKPSKIAEMPSIALTKKSEQAFASMVERPLFIKGRRPVPESPETIKAAVTKPSGPFNWQLNGIYSKDSGLYALLTRSVRLPKGNFKKLTQGEDVDGWTLKAIHKDKVVLNQAGMTKELLLRKSKPKIPKNAQVIDPNNPNPALGQVQAQPPQPNQPMMQPPPPNGEAQPPVMPDADPDAAAAAAAGAVDGQPINDDAAPEAEPLPGSEENAIPEPEPFQPDEFSQETDTSAFDNGTNEQF